MITDKASLRDTRGMTGIGVLILFIALVLVAAIAAGLILDTAGLLQNTAQNTGEESMSEVSDRLSVLSGSGDVTGVVVNVESSENGDVNENATVVLTNQDTSTSVDISAGVPYDLEDGTYTVEAYLDDNHETVTRSDVAIEGGQQINLRLPYNEGESPTDPSSGNAVEDTDFVNPIDNPAIEELRLAVYRSPGAGDVNLQQATIEYFSPYGTAFLIHENRFAELSDEERTEFTEDLGTFHVEAISDDEVSVPVLSSRSDRALILTPLFDNPTGTETVDGDPAPSGEPEALRQLEGGDSATLRITTQEGATSMYIMNAPESLNGSAGGSVQL